MEKLPSTDKLKEALAIAERTLEELKEDSSKESKQKIKRITNAVEKAYEILNKQNYSKKEVEKRTDEIWVSLMNDDHSLSLIIFFTFVLLGIIVFTVLRAYAFIQTSVNENNYSTLER